MVTPTAGSSAPAHQLTHAQIIEKVQDTKLNKKFDKQKEDFKTKCREFIEMGGKREELGKLSKSITPKRGPISKPNWINFLINGNPYPQNKEKEKTHREKKAL